MFKFGIYEPTNKVIDPMGSVIVNTNATGSPNFEWIYTSQVGGYGVPATEIGSVLPYSDSVSYKIKLLDRIPKIGSTLPLVTTTTTTSSTTSTTTTGTTTTTTSSSTTTTPLIITEPEDLSSLASSACYSNNSNIYQNCLSGPYRIGSKLYYVDFRVMYLVNLGDQPIYSPIFAVDTQKCNENYGIFIGVPKVSPNFTVDANFSNNRVPIFLKNPAYSNQLNFFNDAVEYKFTVIKSGATLGSNEEITETLPLTRLTIPQLVSQVAGITDENVISSGQTSIVAETVNSTPIYLSGSSSNLLSSKSFYPFVLFRYISATAPTAPVEIAFTVAPNIG
jgi:hypothetical protein